ncbi:MAG: DUF6935 domain-containing protein [Christensenellales bacterium]
MKRIVSLLLAALTLSAAGCSKAPEALDMPSKIHSQVEQALPESGKRPDEIALPEAQTRQDQPVVTDQAEPEPDQTGLPRQSRPSRNRIRPGCRGRAGRAAGGRPHNHGGKDMQITFDRLPDTLEEFSALCNDLTKPENTCALFLLALNLYTKDKAAGEKAIDMLRGPRPMTGIDSQFIRDRLRDKKYLPLAYFDGATPENGYGPTQPYVLNFYPDQRPQDCEEGYMRLFLKTAGADAARPINLRQKGDNWYLWEYSSILTGIRVPAEEDPWA